MKSVNYQRLGIRLSDYRCKLVSSLAVLDNSSVLPGKHVQNLTATNPVQFFNDWAKSKSCTIRDIKTAHAHFLKTDALNADVVVASSLVGCYCKYASTVYALKVFDKILHLNVPCWNIMISGYNDNSLFGNSWLTFCRMHASGFRADQFTYGSVLSACGALQSPLYGKQLYSLAIRDGFFSDGYLQTGMIDLLARYSSFDDALRVFFDVSCDNIVCWNAIISSAVKNKENFVALNLFSQMCSGLLSPNTYTFSTILTACATLKDLVLGKAVQGQVIKCGCKEDVFVETAVVDLYTKCGEMDEALKEFSTMSNPNVVSWTTIISGFVQQGDAISALNFFSDMIRMREEINKYTVTSVLTACVNSSLINEAIQIHGWTFKSGFYLDSSVKATLINLYSKLGEYYLSKLVFRDSEDFRNLRTWAVMISAFAQNGCLANAMDLFKRMFYKDLMPDTFCSSSVLSIVNSLHLGRQIHSYTIKFGLVFDISVSSSLFTMYSKCGDLDESYEVFREIEEKDNISWSSMIAGFAEHGCAYEAIELFRDMLFEEAVPDETTLTAVLTACSDLHWLKMGKEIHAYALHQKGPEQIPASGALVNMYSKCGALDLARRVFSIMPIKDHVSCSSLVSGYARGGYFEAAIQLFREMLAADLPIDSFTISSVLGPVALLNRSRIGTQMHARTVKTGLDSKASVGSSLIMMYSKCGSIDDCDKIFNQIREHDVISWTAMIVSNAQHGMGIEALKTYEQMRKSGIKPDSVTFVGILSACSHTGLVEEGYSYLNSMVKDFGIEPGCRHYACMVDLLGRSGRLKEAEGFIKSLPTKADALVWGTLLAACKVHGDVELGKVAAQKVIELEPNKCGAYVSLSNICADVGEWDQVLRIRREMKGTGINKEPGWSYV